uniref:Uncharacterized protein n=1 Tax=Nothobranchius furzeri TaxID=105023 RepID=A0A8C6PAM6_NOTFU
MLFGIKAPSSVQLTGWRKHFNSYSLQGRRNVKTHSHRFLNVLTDHTPAVRLSVSCSTSWLPMVSWW